jgi:hypothetical protein
MSQRFSEYEHIANWSYETPAWVTEIVVDGYLRGRCDCVWDPCDGPSSKMAAALKAKGFRVLASNDDFLSRRALPDGVEAIVTNPPYDIGGKFTHQGEMPNNVTTTSSAGAVMRPHLEKFFSQVDPVRGRLVFAVDATASRQPTWDMASALTTEMFAAVASDKLEIQLVYYRGDRECVSSNWMSDAKALARAMSAVTCRAGMTQIERILKYVGTEDQRKKVNACVIISDACEETETKLYTRARELDRLPVFMFQEGPDERVAEIYQKIASMTGGAYCRFESGAAARLAELLKAVVVFAVGGVKALANEKSEAARLLLTQIRK